MTPRGTVGGVRPDRATLAGAGSTFFAPLVVEWARLYRVDTPGVTVDYAPVGSDSGIARLVDGDVDFAVSEVPLNPAELRAAGGEDDVIQLPVAGGPVVLAYNLKGVEGLRLSAEALAGIFDGRITRWDDPVLRAANPGVALPSTAVTPVHRADPSGTTVVFTEYLRQAVDRWPLGVARRVGFPRGLAVTGADGVARAVQRTSGAVGYTSAVAAARVAVASAAVQNRAGRFVVPTVATAGAALDGATGADAGLAVFVPPDLDGPAVYPIVAFTHLVFRLAPEQATGEPAALRHFAAWILSEGQRSAEAVGYLPVPYSIQLRSYEALQAGSTRPIQRD